MSQEYVVRGGLPGSYWYISQKQYPPLTTSFFVQAEWFTYSQAVETRDKIFESEVFRRGLEIVPCEQAAEDHLVSEVIREMGT